MSDTTVPTLELSSGGSMPAVGLGTWLAPKGEVGAAVTFAISTAGYTHIDCASNYRNEDEVGDALAELMADGSVKREDLFITSKLNNPYHRPEHAAQSVRKTLKDLNLEYLDLYLMHWPVAFLHVPFDPDMRGFPEDYDPDGLSGIDLSANGGSPIDRGVSIRDTWEAMEQMVDEGLVKAIGVSNFTTPLIHDLLTYARIKPAVNQYECHPYCQQPQLLAYLQREGIVAEAYSPLGAGGFVKGDQDRVLDDPVLAEIAEAHGKSVAQVCLRWGVQRGCVVIPKSTNEGRLQQNIDLFDFELTEDEMARIAAIDRNHHYLKPVDWYSIPLFTP